MSFQRLPVDGGTRDWPRKVSAAVAAVQNAVTDTQTDVTALQTATDYSLLADYADDTAAAAGGVAVGKLYRTASAVKVRVA